MYFVCGGLNIQLFIEASVCVDYFLDFIIVNIYGLGVISQKQLLPKV